MFENREGQRIPQAGFRTRTEGGEWKTLTTDELFKDKTVVVFSLPGAFTPTCSSTHVPRYNELAPAFFANGVDRIVCVSVNDAFVMNEWARTQECGNILMLPDGNGEFTEKMGLLLGLAAYVPLVGFFAPVVFGLAFIHYLLGAVAQERITPGYQPHPDKSLDRGNAAL